MIKECRLTESGHKPRFEPLARLWCVFNGNCAHEVAPIKRSVERYSVVYYTRKQYAAAEDEEDKLWEGAQVPPAPRHKKGRYAFCR